MRVKEEGLGAVRIRWTTRDRGSGERRGERERNEGAKVREQDGGSKRVGGERGDIKSICEFVMSRRGSSQTGEQEG